MIIRVDEQIKKWTDWDHKIDGAAQNFITRHACAPNILVANEQTLSQIDVVATTCRAHNISHIEDGSDLPEGEFASLDSFAGDGYSLMFCIDPELPTKHFSLIFDDDPDGDGEPLPEDDVEDMSVEEIHEFFDSLLADIGERKAG